MREMRGQGTDSDAAALLKAQVFGDFVVLLRGGLYRSHYEAHELTQKKLVHCPGR